MLGCSGKFCGVSSDLQMQISAPKINVYRNPYESK